jgi:hypothetical protein
MASRDIAYQQCLKDHALDFFANWVCRGASAAAEAKCLEKAGLSIVAREGSGVQCVPFGPSGFPIPAVP